MLSKANKPAFQAVGEIIKKLDISDDEIKAVWESNGSWSGTVNKYKKSVVDKIQDWINSNNFPTIIVTEKKNYYIVYRICD